MLVVGRDMAGRAIWVVAVLGAAMVMVSPITPWLVPLEILGLVTCLAASAALVLWFVRQ